MAQPSRHFEWFDASARLYREKVSTMSIETINTTKSVPDIDMDGRPLTDFEGDVTKYFMHVRQRHITLTQDLLATRQMLLQERDQANLDKEMLARIRNELYPLAEGKNERLRDIDLSLRLKGREDHEKHLLLLAQEQANISVFEGRLEEHKHAMKRAELELRFCIALLEGNRHE